MFRGLYSSTTALTNAALNQEVVAHNIAHANAPGYRRRAVTFESFEQALSSATGATFLGSRPAAGYSTFTQGPIQQTGAPLDVAISGDAFFVVDGPRGPLYTRSGVFEINAQGGVQTKGGLPVAGQVTIPEGTAQILVNQNGEVIADGTVVGRFQLAQFQNPGRLRPVGTTLFEAPPDAQPGEVTSTVLQGFREGSNVEVVNEMVSMIQGVRHYEAAQRALRTMSEALSQNTRPQG